MKSIFFDEYAKTECIILIRSYIYEPHSHGNREIFLGNFSEKFLCKES